jgi:hypothetical protein
LKFENKIRTKFGRSLLINLALVVLGAGLFAIGWVAYVQSTCYRFSDMVDFL